MWTPSRRSGRVIQRNKAAPQPLGRRPTGRLCLLAGFCLLVLAVMPVAAQAEPKYWQKNGSRMPEGQSVPIVTYGESTNLSQMLIGEVNCKTVGGGTIENPVGGGRGVGRTNALASYECKAPQCEEKVKLEFGVEGRATISFQNNPAATKEPAFPQGGATCSKKAPSPVRLPSGRKSGNLS